MVALLQVVHANVNGLPEDAAQHDFVVSGIDSNATAAQLLDLNSSISDFYNALAAGQTNSMGGYLSDALSRAAGASITRCFDITAHLDGTPHGSPFANLPFTLPAAIDTVQLPHEVAFVITLEAVGRATALVETPDSGDPGTARDRPKSRHTGRIYLGPLNQDALDGTGTQARPAAVLQTDARLAVRKLAADLAADGFSLRVWSRVDATHRGLEAVSTDDAWDVQRRRGVQKTARTRLAIP